MTTQKLLTVDPVLDEVIAIQIDKVHPSDDLRNLVLLALHGAEKKNEGDWETTRSLFLHSIHAKIIDFSFSECDPSEWGHTFDFEEDSITSIIINQQLLQ